MFVDTHCHLADTKFDPDRDTVIANAKKAGVKRIIVPGAGYASSVDALHLAMSRPDVLSPACGIHPYEATRNGSIDEFLSSIRPEGIVAIGECGLDYHLYKGFDVPGKKDDQKQAFFLQCQFAIRHNLPVIIHCRDAFSDLFDVLDALPTMPQGVIHCFSGTREDGQKALIRGLYIGIDGNSTYAKKLREVIQTIPLSSILLETDSPYLPPAPHRGERNEPKYIQLIADSVSQLYGIPKKTVEQETTANALALFFPHRMEMIQ